MFVNINNKVVSLTEEEYEAMFGTTCPIHPHHYKPLNKMDKLIDAVESIKDAIDRHQAIEYSLEKEGSTIKLVGTDGSQSSVEDKDENTTYNVSIEDRTISMYGSDNSVQRIELPEDKDTKYDISFNDQNDKISLNSSDGEEDSIDVSKFATDDDLSEFVNNTATTEDLDNLFNH